MTIGEIIYQNRKRAGLSQEELANLLNVTRQSISLWETDQSIPTTEKLICLADVFQISMDELCARNGPTPQPRTNPSDCIAVSETDCDEALYRKIYRITFRQTRFWSICAIVICAIWSIAMLYFDMKWTVVFPIFLMICLIVFLVSVQTSINNNIASQLNAHPHHKMRICFFIDRFEVEAVSDTSTSFYQKAYGELTRVLSDEEYFFLQFDNLLAVVKKADLGAERETIENCSVLPKKRR